MAKKRKAGSSPKNVVSIVGADILLRKIEDFGKDVEDVMEKAVKKGALPIKTDMIRFMSQHKRRSNGTLNAFQESEPTWVDGDMKYGFGWLTNRGGLPALFLEIGTPTQKPYFFAYYSKKNNMQKFDAIVLDYLERYITEVWG